jgi:hypothetical protein
MPKKNEEMKKSASHKTTKETSLEVSAMSNTPSALDFSLHIGVKSMNT